MDRVSSHPILTCAAAKAWETALLRDEAAEWAAMQQAGSALAAAIREDFREIGGWPADARLFVLAGKGHNGGDALLAARELLLASPNARADVLLAFAEAALRPLARRSLDALENAAPGRVTRIAAPGPRYDLGLDGLFGFQFRPPLDPRAAALIAAVNAHPAIRVRAAVDLPSGLAENASTGALRADFTYATGIVKTPVLRPEAAEFVGRLRYLDLGFFATEPTAARASARVLGDAGLLALAGLRPAQSDKRTFGHLVVVGGSRSYPGAVLMAVQAALRSGVGLLTAFVPESLVPEYAARLPEAMWVGWPENAAGGLSAAVLPRLRDVLARASALLIGPGLGAAPETLAAVEAVVRQAGLPLVLDADALRPGVVAAAAGRRLILTPHAGELQRLGGLAGPALAAAEEVVVIAKGSPTRIEARTAAGPGPAYYSFFGGPVLARGGSGDLLAGLTAGLLAQAGGDLLLAAARGAVWHGLAADLLARDRGQVAVQTTQVLDFLQPALALAVHHARTHP